MKQFSHSRSRCAGVVLSLLFCALWAASGAAEVMINGTGVVYATIQAGLDAAWNGDVVRVSTGAYVGQISFVDSTNYVTIRGGYDTDCTTFIGGGHTMVSTSKGPDVRVIASRLVLDALDLIDSGGGIFASNQASVFCVNCRIHDNVKESGAGIHADASRVALDQTRVFHNDATNGGADRVLGNWASSDGAGVFAIGSMLVLSNAVVTGNEAERNGGALFLWYDTTGALAEVVLTNCIVWGNTNLQVQSGQAVQYSDVQGGYPGTRNFSAEPLFASPAALDYQLLEPSPCIDTGIFVYVLRDCLGVLRTAGAGVDLGAYEYVPEPAAALLRSPWMTTCMSSRICRCCSQQRLRATRHTA